MLSVVPPEAAVGRCVARSPRRPRTRRPLVADLNAVSPGYRARDRLAPRRRRDRGGRRRDLRPAARRSAARHGSISRAGAPGRSRPSRSTGSTRVVVGDARRARLGGEDVHGVRLQGPRRASRAGASHRARLRRASSTCSTISSNGARRPRRTRARRSRARSAKAWRYVAEMEEIAATQAAAGLTPELFRALAVV